VLSSSAPARLVCWLNAWLAGRVSTDATIDGLVGAGRCEFRQPTVEAEPLSAAGFLGHVRRLGATRATLALPVPGDLLGLGGPPEFNAAALDEGGAVLLAATGLGAVGRLRGSTQAWVLRAADEPAFLPDVALADRDLRGTLIAVADALAAQDVARWNPDVADALMNLRSPDRSTPALPFASAAAARLATTAQRCLTIVELAGRDAGAAVTAAEADRRRASLQPLERASRAAVVAACSSYDGR
jgi:hypothetical protein